jgi:adenosine tuberculosinyltransferase
MNLETFQDLPQQAVSDLVQAGGPHVCVFPINGTRRWLALEHPDEAASPEALVTRTGEQVRRLAQLFFDHGVSTMVMPVFGGELLSRGAIYRQMAEAGLRQLTEPDFLSFYAESDIRVRFYGDFRAQHPDLIDLLKRFEETERATAAHRTRRLFFGVCGESATLAITQHAAQCGRALSHEEAVVAFYGEPLGEAELYIGFDAPTAFDMPLIDQGNVALYFTVAPSPYLDATALRGVLYDWIHVRPDHSDYGSMSSDAWDRMRQYYRTHRHAVIGRGVRRDGIWYPHSDISNAERRG